MKAVCVWSVSVGCCLVSVLGRVVGEVRGHGWFPGGCLKHSAGVNSAVWLAREIAESFPPSLTATSYCEIVLLLCT